MYNFTDIKKKKKLHTLFANKSVYRFRTCIFIDSHTYRVSTFQNNILPDLPDCNL